MADPRLDYEELDSAARAGPDDVGGMPAHDRIQIVGWVGLFLSPIPGMAAVLYLGRPARWTVEEAGVAFGLAGVLTGLYAVAGSWLVVRGLRPGPVEGDAVRYFNLLILGPFLVVAPLAPVGPVFVVIYSWVALGRVEPVTLLMAVLLLPSSIQNLYVIVSKRREFVRGLRPWLDPTWDSRPVVPPAD